RMRSKLIFVVLCIAAASGAQSSKEVQAPEQGTQARGYWIDPSTNLMWAGKDNGTDISWKKAVKYCRNLRLANYSDWRLASLPELTAIYDKRAESPGENPKSRWHEAEPMAFHVKGNLFLTGGQWSSEYRKDDRGKNSGYSWYFDFNEGRADNDPTGWPYSDEGRRALCVRNPTNAH
ncbi:MAG TPA: DUF1566 domain-containing protein, partial [Acidobacteriaceae bacterium]|nr:DUF1566 domain-containing protein [Acidobacteriaceae bacterium]